MTRTMRLFRSNSNSPSNSSRSFGKSMAKVEKIPLLVLARKWDDLISLLQTPKYGEALREYMGDSTNYASATQNSASFLHFVCRFHPTLDVVRLICNYESNAPSQIDSRTGHYPLHVAIGNGAGPSVLKFLMLRNMSAVSVQDNMGRTALHIAAQYYRARYEPKWEDTTSPLSKKEATYELVNALCTQAPDIVNLEDAEGMTAIEYALDAENNLRVIKRIQKVSEKYWKKAEKQKQESLRSLRLSSTPSSCSGSLAPEIDPQVRANIQEEKQRIQQDILRMTETARQLAMTSVSSVEKGNSKQDEDTQNTGASSNPVNIIRLSKRRSISPKGNEQNKSQKAIAA